MAVLIRMEAIFLTMVLGASLWAGAMSQSSCNSVIISMSPCLNYISGNSSGPSSGCCTQLASVVRSQPQCLCEVVNGDGSSMGIQINQTRALSLPDACIVQTPPLGHCNGAASPAGAPQGTPSSGNGTKKVDGDSSSAMSVKSPFSLVFFLAFFVSYAAATFTSI